MKKLTLDNLDELAIGCAILGSGGGGDPPYYYKMARHEIEKHGPITLIAHSELSSKDFILPIGFWGAPLIEKERVPSGREFAAIHTLVEKTLKHKTTAVMPIEIGGGNAFAPLIVAAQLKLPVLDADLVGRAFPEAQMTASLLTGCTPPIAFIADCMGNLVTVESKNSIKLEKIGRHITVGMGSSSVFGFYPISTSQISKNTIPKSISKAISIGKAHSNARQEGKDPLKSILDLCKGCCLASGRIIDIERGLSRGFVNGYVIIEEKNKKLELTFQNEYLIAKSNGKIVATTPDILMLIEKDTGTPIPAEALQYGLKVNLIALPAPKIWTSSAGLALVGPRYFGYEIDYQPANKINIESLT